MKALVGLSLIFLLCGVGYWAIVVYPEAVWYRAVTAEDIDDIVQQHLIGGRPVRRLLMTAPEVDPAAVGPEDG